MGQGVKLGRGTLQKVRSSSAYAGEDLVAEQVDPSPGIWWTPEPSPSSGVARARTSCGDVGWFPKIQTVADGISVQGDEQAVPAHS